MDGRSYVTGMGIISPIGNDLERFWDSLVTGQSGIRKITRFNTDDLPTQIAGEVELSPESLGRSKILAKHSSRHTQLAAAATLQAINDSGVKVNNENKEKIAVIVGSSICGLSDNLIATYQKGWKHFNVIDTVKYCNHAPAYTIGLIFGITGPTLTITSACNSSACAIEYASDLIKLKKIDLAIVVGAETVTESTYKAFCKGRAMSTHNANPAQASRPFDLDRDGFVYSEGAGAIILESLESVNRRGAYVYGELAGCGATNDAHSLLVCEPEGKQIAGAMKKALSAARMEPSDISYISTHGPGIQITDLAETIAIKKVFDTPPWSPSIKGAIGSPLGATNAIQFVAACLSLKHQVVPPTINLDTPDPKCDLDYVPHEARDLTVQNVMINSHAYGGGNASIVVSRE